jgi:calcium binding protein 39
VIYPSSDPLTSFTIAVNVIFTFQLFNVLFSQDSSKNIQIEAFHVFKVSSTPIAFILIHRSLLTLIIVHYASQLFAANKNKPAEVVNILVTNRSKLLRFFAGFKIDKEDEQFEADKEQVIKEISAL